LVGELHKGWSYGKYLLGHERTGIAGIGSCKQQLARARLIAQEQGLENEAWLQSKLMQFEVELMALEFTALRLLGQHQQSKTPAVEASMLKVKGTELRQAIYETLVEIAGPQAIPFSAEAQFLEHLSEAPQDESLAALAANCLDSRKVTIYGGTNEVQRNLIAKATLAAY